MKLVRLQCTQCGAQLPEQKESGSYVCSYCGCRFQSTGHNQAQEKPAPPVIASAQSKKSAPRIVSLLSIVSGLVPLAIGGVVMYKVMGPSLKGSISGARLGSPLRALWDSVGGPPVPVSIGGKEAVIGRMRLSEDELHIVATDSATGQPLWKVGPLGTYGEGYQVTHFAVSQEKNRVVITDARGAVRICELQSGRELKRVPLPDRATNVCASDPAKVSVAVMDGHHIEIELESLTFREAPLPPGCDPRHRTWRNRDVDQRVRRPSLRGFDVTDAHAEGELGVAAAVKSPGTPIPYAIGFTPQSREVRWKQLLPTVEPMSVRPSEWDGLAGGRYVAVYGVGSAGWHLTALDARDGARLWDVELRPLFAVDHVESLVLGPRYAYVNRTSSLEIFDATTGKLAGTVGNETYKSGF